MTAPAASPAASLSTRFGRRGMVSCESLVEMEPDMSDAEKIAELERALEVSRAETRAAFENRAVLYAYLFDELESELGVERATEVMKRAIYRRGLDVGRAYREAAEAGDLEEVARLFADRSPQQGALFEPGVEEPAEGGRIVIRMTGCPLAEAWRDAGYQPERVDLLCEIAAAVDEGTFAAAGLELAFLDRQGCVGSDRCLLELRVRNA
ncbi:MAG: hypothetical protein FDZ75_00020 [Actinobacteria bacterium]|nr:MAG: hypothetical protein FDZ75_00020 [Actinomycetota bacterium]